MAPPQLSDWGEASAEQAIALTEYLLGHYNIHPGRVYASGYSGGGNLFARDPAIMGWLFAQRGGAGGRAGT